MSCVSAELSICQVNGPAVGWRKRPKRYMDSKEFHLAVVRLLC